MKTKMDANTMTRWLLAVVLSIGAVAACAKDKRERKMPTITIPNKTVGRIGNYKIAVGSILKEDCYEDADGKQKTGPVALLSIVKKGVPDQKPRLIYVGAGSGFKLDGILVHVISVTPGDEGIVTLRPDK